MTDTSPAALPADEPVGSCHPGGYCNFCMTCGGQFIGAKRCLTCRGCAIAALADLAAGGDTQREEDAVWCEGKARFWSRVPDGDGQPERFRRLAAYARAPLAPPTEAEVEAAARTIASNRGWDWEGGAQPTTRQQLRDDARAALAAFVAGRTGG